MIPLRFVAIAVLAASGFASAAPSDDPLQGFRWQSRVIVAVADFATDPHLEVQRKLYHGMRPGARERDLILLEATGSSPQAAALRRRFDLGPGFTVLLIGKDGGEKLRSATPLGPGELFGLIDAMPMRQDEMRRQP